jgi:hypothetical protein
MENEKFFVSESGRLVILHEEGGAKRITVCEPIEEVTVLETVVTARGKKGNKKVGERHCKKCGKAGHRSDGCPEK